MAFPKNLHGPGGVDGTFPDIQERRIPLSNEGGRSRLESLQLSAGVVVKWDPIWGDQS